LWVTEIAYHRTLVAIERLKKRGSAFPERRAPAACIIAIGLFHLDDLGTQFTQDVAGKWGRNAVTQFDDHQPFEGLRGRGGRSSHAINKVDDGLSGIHIIKG
jgi:hypothetical protein